MDEIEVSLYIYNDLDLVHGTGWVVLGCPGSAWLGLGFLNFNKKHCFIFTFFNFLKYLRNLKN